MSIDAHRWIATVDSREGRLIRVEPVHGGRWHADQVGSIRNEWEGYHEHGRPEGLSKGRGTPAKSEGYSFAAGSHDEAEMRRRFARDVARWLEEEIRRQGIERLDLFAPPSFLGDLRGQIGRLNGRIREHQGQLNPIAVNDLPDHAAIAPLFAKAG